MADPQNLGKTSPGAFNQPTQVAENSLIPAPPTPSQAASAPAPVPAPATTPPTSQGGSSTQSAPSALGDALVPSLPAVPQPGSNPAAGGGTGGNYQTVQKGGVALLQRPTLDFTGPNITVVDDPGNNSTDVSVGPMSSTIEVAALPLGTTDILNFTAPLERIYLLACYYRVTVASTFVTITVTYTSKSGVQTLTLQARSNLTVQDYGSEVIPVYALAGTKISINVTPETAGQVFATEVLL